MQLYSIQQPIYTYKIQGRSYIAASSYVGSHLFHFLRLSWTTSMGFPQRLSSINLLRQSSLFCLKIESMAHKLAEIVCEDQIDCCRGRELESLSHLENRKKIKKKWSSSFILSGVILFFSLWTSFRLHTSTISQQRPINFSGYGLNLNLYKKQDHQGTDRIYY